MKCISRCTDETYVQHFADERHKFYLEFRCNRPCTNDIYCSKCSNKSPIASLQQSRKFNHRDVNEPIPDNSHIFGGKWYNEGVRKWGEPASDIIEFAIKYRKEAHEGLNLDKIPNTMVPIDIQLPIGIQLHIDTPLPIDIQLPIKRNITLDNTLPKSRRKPKIASEPIHGTLGFDSEPMPKAASVPMIKAASEPKPRVPRKKPLVTPYSTLISTNVTQLIHKEVSLPTHIETKLEEIDTNGYTIQYIKLVLFDANGISYFRDAVKNKLYKKIKDTIGGYIGRWNPNTDSIIDDIPDSDEE